MRVLSKILFQNWKHLNMTSVKYYYNISLAISNYQLTIESDLGMQFLILSLSA